MKFKRERETKRNIVFKAVDDDDVQSFSTLYIKKESALAQLIELEFKLVAGDE